MSTDLEDLQRLEHNEALVKELYPLIAKELIRRIKSGIAGPDTLSIARRLCDQGGALPGPIDHKQLAKLRKLYVDALMRGVTEGFASAALLAEIGLFLDRCGVVKDLARQAESLQAIQQFTTSDLKLPFQ